MTSTKVRAFESAHYNPYGQLELTVRDKHGHVLQRIEQKVDSFLDNYWRLAYALHGGTVLAAGTLTLTGVNASPRPRVMTVDGSLESYMGIIVGSGTTAVALNDTNLATRIENGVSSGQLSAEDVSVAYDNATRTATVIRTFVNVNPASGTIDVNEVGVTAVSTVTRGQNTSSSTLIIRDVLGSTLSLPHEAVLTVVYTMQLFNGCDNYRKAMLQFMMAKDLNLFTAFGSVQYYDNTGTIRTGTLSGNENNPFPQFVAPLGEVNRGIALGSANTTPVQTNTYELDTPIMHGTGAGELFYYESTISSYSTNATSGEVRWYLNRVVQNQTDTAIDVRELALKSNVTFNSSNYYMLFDRKLPDDGVVTIAPSAFATFSWEICYNLV